MLSQQQFSFSQSYSQKRIALANKVLGPQLVKRIIGFALYLLGAGRKSIAEFIDLPYDTFKSFTERVEIGGISAFPDRRRKKPASLPLPVKPEEKTTAKVSVVESCYVIDFGTGDNPITIPIKNIGQLKVILLSLLRSKLIPLEDVAQTLNYSRHYTSQLAGKLYNSDLEVLFDHRLGQRTDYVFTPEIKSEIILQAAGNAIIGKSTSSSSLAEDLQNRKNVKLSARSIRLHVSRLGLKDISSKLPLLLNTLKKTQRNSFMLDPEKAGIEK
jgi:hypothetical protein